MLRPEQPSSGLSAGVRQSLALQGILAAVILVAALFSRDNPLVFFLTLSLLAIPISITARYLIAARKGAKR